MKAYKHMIGHLTDLGYTLAVFSEGDTLQSPTKRNDLLLDAVESVELAQVNVYDFRGISEAHARQLPNGLPECLAYAIVIPYDVGDDETVADWSCGKVDLIDQWFEVYQSYCDKWGS